MKARTIASRILIVLLATLLLLASASLAWGVVVDYQSRGLVPTGVSVAGQDLGGMTEAAGAGDHRGRSLHPDDAHDHDHR